jgi:hypothetical protein
MSIPTTVNTDCSSIDATSILLMKLMKEQQSNASKKGTITTAMRILTLNTDNSSIDAASILLMKLKREQQSSVSKKVVTKMLTFEDQQTKTIPIPHSIRPACSPSTSKSTGAIGNWLKKAKFHEKHASLPRQGGGGLRKASTTQQFRQEQKGFLLAATKKGSSVKAHSMSTFRVQSSNGTSRDQYVNREVFARRLHRDSATLVVKTMRM